MVVSTTAAETFHRFQDLPAELRLHIWKFSVDSVGFITVTVKDHNHMPTLTTPLWSVNHESRETAIRVTKVEPDGVHRLVTSGRNGQNECKIMQGLQVGTHRIMTLPRKWALPFEESMWMEHNGASYVLFNPSRKDPATVERVAREVLNCRCIEEAMWDKALCFGGFVLLDGDRPESSMEVGAPEETNWHGETTWTSPFSHPWLSIIRSASHDCKIWF
ncbi:hypothetical protein TruAng_003355 [Truncatella angustata]|nr:hypothetical protein TruAng_003355 [Truncatella angustata]